MHEAAFMESIERIRARDPRYDSEAYFFIREALSFTMKMLDKPEEGPARHVSGGELLEGIRRYALDEFGPITLKVLHTWGIRNTQDIGEIVFNMVEAGELGRTDEDRREDFANGFDFEDAFAKPFLPRKRPAENKSEQQNRRGGGMKEENR
jgi:uncharacterized repeat protein (TIGR04138 family)